MAAKEAPAYVPPTVNVDSLRAQVKGDIFVYGEPGYEEARGKEVYLRDPETAFGFPAALVLVKSAEDVAAALKFATAEGLSPTIVCGGHGWQHHLNGVLCIDLSHHMGGTEIEPETRIVTVQGGAKLGNVDIACEPHGIAITAGRVPSTGAGGQFTCTGGHGYMQRKFKLGIDMMLSAEVVLASGEIVTADADGPYSDLFWAIRGGGGNFGVVTKFVFQGFVVPNGGQLFGGVRVHLPLGFFGRPKRLEQLAKWTEMALAAPDEFSGDIIIQRGGRMTPMIDASAWCGDPEEGKAWYEKNVFTIGKPVASMVATVSYWKVIQRMALGPGEKNPNLLPGCHYFKGVMVPKITPAMLKTIAEACEMSGPTGVFCTCLLMMLGGEAGRVPLEATALPLRVADFWITIVGRWDPAKNAATRRGQVVEWVKALHSKLLALMVETHEGDEALSASWEAGGQTDIDEVLQKTGAGEKKPNVKVSSFGVHTERLLAIKAKYDPKNLFKHSISLV